MAPLVSWFKKNMIDILKISIICLIVIYSSWEKYKVFDETSGELNTFSSATMDFLEGNNPYLYTVKTFEEPEIYTDHGFSYFSTYLYIYSIPLTIHQRTGYPIQRLWKSLILMADIGVSYLLVKILYKKSYLATVFSVAVWCINPYFLINKSYSYTETFGIFFMILALMYLEKDDIKTGLFYAVSVSFKAFPMVMFPMFFIKSKDKLKFLGSGALFAFLISIPFMKSVKDFIAYMKGAFFVHSSRPPQGRPFLFFIKYYTALPLFSLKHYKVYTYLATFSGWLVTSLLIILKKAKNKYLLAMISLSLFLLFTPYLARTHMIWLLPVLCIGLFDVLYKKNKFLYFLFVISFYAFYAWYLSIWDRGVRVFGDFISL